MEYKYYKGKEPTGRDRHLEVIGLIGTPINSSVKESLVEMAKCVELYIMNECDCDKLTTRDYDDSTKKANAMKAVRSMGEDNDKLWNHLQDRHALVINSDDSIPTELFQIMNDVANLPDICKKAILVKREEAGAQYVPELIEKEEQQAEEQQVVRHVLARLRSLGSDQNDLYTTLEAMLNQDPAEHAKALKNIIELIENGSSKDLVEYASKVKEQLYA